MNESERRNVEDLYAAVDARCAKLRVLAPSWPCRAGCSACCEQLSELPRITRIEWELLREHIVSLDSELRHQIARSIEQCPTQNTLSGKVKCPLLDTATRCCLVYEGRPAACRSYGFYRDRSHDLWCHEVEQFVATLDPHGLVCGNQASLERDLVRISAEEPRSILEWYRLDERPTEVEKILV